MTEKDMLLLRDWDGREVHGWLASEKLDGCRAYPSEETEVERDAVDVQKLKAEIAVALVQTLTEKRRNQPRPGTSEIGRRVLILEYLLDPKRGAQSDLARALGLSAPQTCVRVKQARRAMGLLAVTLKSEPA